jgi:transcriptional regulator with XRE-family HTH domain
MGNRHSRPRPDRLAEKLSQIRETPGLTLEQMARALRGAKKSPPTKDSVYRFERGEREPSLLVLLEYSRFAEVSLEVLVDDDLDLPKRFRTKRLRRG